MSSRSSAELHDEKKLSDEEFERAKAKFVS